MSRVINLSQSQIDYLLSPKAIRERAQKIFELTQNGNGHFSFHEEKLKPTVDYVLDVINEKYPDLKIPFHSRWRHFRAGGIDRAKRLSQELGHLSPIEKARTQLDLVITSILYNIIPKLELIEGGLQLINTDPCFSLL